MQKLPIIQGCNYPIRTLFIGRLEGLMITTLLIIFDDFLSTTEIFSVGDMVVQSCTVFILLSLSQTGDSDIMI